MINARVLIVEGEPDAAATLVRDLGQLGCDVVARTSEDEEALRLAAVLAPDAAIVDFRQPARGQKRTGRLFLLAAARSPDVVASMTTLAPDISILRLSAPQELAAALRLVLHAREQDEELHEAQEERMATDRLFALFRGTASLDDLIRESLAIVHELSHCDAAAIRLAEGDDFPYFDTRGFSRSFVEREHYLCERDFTGRVRRDHTGKPFLACLCGAVLAGRRAPGNSYLTERGTFWTNAMSDVHDQLFGGQQPHGVHLRNHCNREGYESVALLPLRLETDIVGLVQLNDKRPKRFTPRRLAMLERFADALALLITHRRDRAAREVSEERFRRLLESTTDYSYAVEHRDGRQVQTRHGVGCERVTGYTVDEFAAQPSLWFDMVVPEDRPAVLAFANRIDSGETPPPIEHRILHKNGATKWVRNTVVSRPATTTGGFVHDGLISDITDRKRLESQLRQAQKMEAMGQLAGGVAHDFNNILATMLMELGLLREEPELSESLRSGLHELETSVARATGLTRQILAFSRRQVMQMKALRLDGLLTDLHKMLVRMLGETISVDLEASPDDHTIKGDGGMIEQVVMNLCLNARDAMPGGGRIHLTIENVSLSEADIARNPEARVGRFVRLRVADTGCGMNEKVRQHLFEPFFTTKETGKGTGLGLSTVYGIVKQHDGWIEVESEEGKGSSFHVLLPAFDVQDLAPSPDAFAQPPRGRGETLLVVEDEPALRLALVSILRRFGYHVIEADNAQTALAVWSDQQRRISLLITDMVMPGLMSGLQLIQALRAERPQLQAIVCSGYLGIQGIPASAGIHVLPKPFETETLLRTVRRSLDEASRDEPPSNQSDQR